MSYDFKKWKAWKMAKGEWLSTEKYRKKKRIGKKKKRRHNKLFKHFVKNQAPIEDLIEDLKDSDDPRADKAKVLINREIILDTETRRLLKHR